MGPGEVEGQLCPTCEAMDRSAHAERQLGIELGGNGWAALLGEDADPDDWDGESESAKRALPRLAPPVAFAPLPALRAMADGIDDCEEDDRPRWLGFHRRWEIEDRGRAGVRAACDDCPAMHYAATRAELVELLDAMHATEPDPDEYHDSRHERSW